MHKKLGAAAAFLIIFAVIIMSSFGSTANTARMKLAAADDCPKVYLTFDDGPSDRVTPRILDTLEREQVKATFFIVGRSAESRSYIIEREHCDGHSVAPHSYSHDYKRIYASPAALLADIEKCNRLIERITGRRSNIYRFPGGSFGLSEQLVSAVTGAGYRYVDWNASCGDADATGQSPERILKNAKSTSADRKTVVLLCHDSTDKSATADALSGIIAYYKQEGFEFCAF